MRELRPGPASLHTRLLYERSLAELPFCDTHDHADAARGRLAGLPGDSAPALGAVGAAPVDGADADTHPSLRRILGLRRISGLFEVVPGVYQVRGLCPRNVTVVAGDHGWILLDPPAAGGRTATVLRMLDRYAGRRPVVAVIDDGPSAGAAVGERIVVDGVVIDSVPVDAAGAGEVVRWLPSFGLLHAGSVVGHSLPPLVGPTGPRDPLAWSKALHLVLLAHGHELAAVAGAHDWPTWGNSEGCRLLADHRDLLRYLHDEVLRWSRRGHSADEVVELLTLPPALATRWHARGYDTTIETSVRLLHARAEPETDEPGPWLARPSRAVADRFVGWAGGVESATGRLDRSFDDGDYRWVAQAGELVLAAEPAAVHVRVVTARAYEQLAYQEESAGRRRFFADRARAVAGGRADRPASRHFCVAGQDVEQVMDHLAVRIDGPRAAGHALRLRWDLVDRGSSHLLSLHNGALFAGPGQDGDVDATVSSTHALLADLACDHLRWSDAVLRGAVRVEGDRRLVETFFGLLDRWECPRRSDRAPCAAHPRRQERP